MDLIEAWDKIYQEILAKLGKFPGDNFKDNSFGSSLSQDFLSNIESLIFQFCYLDTDKEKNIHIVQILNQLEILTKFQVIRKDADLSQKILALISQAVKAEKSLEPPQSEVSAVTTPSEIVQRTPPVSRFLTIIPADLLVQIFQYLSPEDIVCLALVSKATHQLTNDYRIWEQLLMRVFPYLEREDYAGGKSLDPEKLKAAVKPRFTVRYRFFYENISFNTRRIFGFVNSRDLAGLKANAHLITFDSLTEYEGDVVFGKNYLMRARDNEYGEIEKFIIRILKIRASNSEYLLTKFKAITEDSEGSENELIVFFQVRFLRRSHRDIKLLSYQKLLKTTVSNDDLNSTIWLLNKSFTVWPLNKSKQTELIFEALTIAFSKHYVDLFKKIVEDFCLGMREVLILAIKGRKDWLVTELLGLYPQCFDDPSHRDNLLRVAVADGSTDTIRLLVTRTVDHLKSSIPDDLVYSAVSRVDTSEPLQFLLTQYDLKRLDSYGLVLQAIKNNGQCLEVFAKAGLNFPIQLEQYQKVCDALFENQQDKNDIVTMFSNLKQYYQFSVHATVLPNGETILHRAVVKGRPILVSALCEFEHAVDRINAPDAQGNTAFHRLFLSPCRVVFEATLVGTLVDAKADVRVKNKDGYSSIDFLMKENQTDRIIEVFKVLHEKKVFNSENSESRQLLRNLIYDSNSSVDDISCCLMIGIDPQNLVDLDSIIIRTDVVRLCVLYGVKPTASLREECRRNWNYGYARRAIAIFDCYEHFENCIAELKSPSKFKFLLNMHFSHSLLEAAKCDLSLTTMLLDKVIDSNKLDRVQKAKLRQCARQPVFSEKSIIPGEPNTSVQALRL